MSSSKTTILLYNGLGSGEDSTKHFYVALTHAVDLNYHSVKYISPEEIIEGSWTKSCCVIAFGGGYDLGFIKALGERGTKRILNFVREGGCYLGICAGAYWACDSIEFDKGGPLQVVGERFLKFYPGQCIGPAFPGFRYNTKKGVHAVPLLYKGSVPFRAYMHGGGYFTIPDRAAQQQCNSGALVDIAMRSKQIAAITEWMLLSEDINVPISSHQSHTPVISSTVTDTISSSLEANGFALSDRIDQMSSHSGVTGNDTHSSDRTRTMKTRDSFSSHTVLGIFTSLGSEPAAVVKCVVGQGMAILSGVHLEFPVSLLDHTDPDLHPVLPQLSVDEDVRNIVFRDLLSQLNVHLRPVKSQL